VNERFAATIYEDAWSPFCLIAERLDDADAIHEFLEDYCRRVPDLAVVRNDVYARFSHATFNKGTALNEIARRLGIRPDHVVAAGDHFNDLPMLSNKYARWLVAPGNAIEPVKSSVRRQNGYVSHLSHGHGVADGLEVLMERLGLPDMTAEMNRAMD
jgi:hydroxymethylpyrimidine pyrophosphatase-like HAD family hydrolase